jgi:hypothetical protein
MPQPLPPQLELPAGDRFVLPTVSTVRELVPPGGQLPTHMVLVLICGKELWIPLDREIGQQMAGMLAPFLPKESEWLLPSPKRRHADRGNGSLWLLRQVHCAPIARPEARGDHAHEFTSPC